MEHAFAARICSVECDAAAGSDLFSNVLFFSIILQHYALE
jgi:hypothetical protein